MAESRFTAGGNQISDSFGLSEIDPAIQKRTASELAGSAIRAPCEIATAMILRVR